MKLSEEAESEDEPEWLQSFQEAQQAEEDGDMEQAAELSVQTFAQLMEEAAKKPPSRALRELKAADKCEARADWEGAEEAFKYAVTLEIEERGYAMLNPKYLARFYSFRDRKSEALATIHAATETARQHYKGRIILAMSLQDEIFYLMAAGEYEKARPLIDEGLHILESVPHDKIFRHNFRLYEAEYCLHNDDLAAAEAILNQMWSQIEAWQQAMFLAGFQSTLASWWKVRALCCQKRGQVSEEIEALRRVVHFRRVIAQAPQLEGPYKFNALAGALHKLGTALQQNGDALAAQVLAESASLRRGIGLEPLS